MPASRPPAAFALVQAAAAVAARAHEGQKRADGRTPYFAHPARVALTLRSVFGCDDEHALAAAFLHDVIEDTTTDYDDLAEAFGPVVADLVAALTKNATLPETRRERDYDQRLAAADWRARLIKLADVYDNASDQASLTPAKRRKIAGKAARAIALANADRAEHPETARAIEAVKALLSTRPRAR
jgi:guanosine-3',5'-bis(diphosphate) 3'-pyrophosphohydrolase